MALSKQMEMFEQGGLKDEGGMVDEVSGNDVPPGSTREEVRDDIPAQLSEGEFVFPADVVRYIGLEKLMMLRQQAKQGLKQMEAMGQMGNADEATMPDDLPFKETDLDIEDDLPFDETDLDIEDDLEYNIGGVVEGQQEIYAPGNFGNLVTPDVPKVQNVRYYNEQLKQVRMIPHLLNPDGSLGNTIYPVPKGFVPQEEPVEKPVEEEEQSGGKREQQGDSSDPSQEDIETQALGGARTTIGDVEYAVQYNFDGTVGLQSLDNFKATGKTNFQTAKPEIAEAIKTQTVGQVTQLGKVKGLGATVAVEIGKKLGIDTPRYDKLTGKIQKGKDATTFLKNTKQKDIFKEMPSVPFTEPAVAKVENLSRAQIKSLDEGIRTGEGTDKFSKEKASDIAKQAEQDRLDKEKREEKAKQRSLKLSEVRRAQRTRAKNKAAQEKAEREGRITGREAGMSMGGSDDPGDSGYSTGEGFDSSTGFGSDISTAVGGLIPKKKKKTKKMKQGGLASKK